MIEEDLLDKDFVTTSAESLNELLDVHRLLTVAIRHLQRRAWFHQG